MPALIINGGGDSPWKWSNFRLSWARDLDLGSGHGHYLFFISHRVLHVYQISSKWKKLFVDGRTDGNLTPILLGRLPKFGSRPNNACTKFPQEYYSERIMKVGLRFRSYNRKWSVLFFETQCIASPIQKIGLGWGQNLKRSWGGSLSSKGLIYSTCVQNFAARTPDVSEIMTDHVSSQYWNCWANKMMMICLIAGVEIENGSCDPDHAPYGGIFIHRLRLEIPSSVQDTWLVPQNLNVSRDLTTPLSGMVCHPWARIWYLTTLDSVYLSNLKSLSLLNTKLWKAIQNVKNVVIWGS